MPLRFVFQVVSLEASRPGRVFGLSALAMLLIFLADVLTPDYIRLHVLYVFPLAAIAMHCQRSSAVWGGLLLSQTLQALTFYEHGIPGVAFVTDVLVSLASSGLTVFLARLTRENYIRLARLANSDGLTGLSNRRGFESLLEREINRQRRYGNVFSLVAIDLNDFKLLNDSQGHAAGDQALQLVAEVLRENTRSVDVVARLGGDEFAILLPNTDRRNCAAVCNDLDAALQQRLVIARFDVSASIGHATFDSAPASLSVALHAADKAMYAVKGARKRKIGGN